MFPDLIVELQDLTALSWSQTRRSSGTTGSFLKSYDEVNNRKRYYKLSSFDAFYGIVGHEMVYLSLFPVMTIEVYKNLMFWRINLFNLSLDPTHQGIISH